MGKAPAFQLYAADFYMDTAGWTATQVGAYFRLLMHEWVNGPLPTSMAQLARISGVDVRNMTKMWSAEIAKKFITDDAKMYVNVRLEQTREDQRIYSEKQSHRATMRWGNNDAAALPADMPKRCSSSSSSPLIQKPPLSPLKPKPAKTTFDGTKFHGIPPELMAKWKQAAPAVNIPQEIAKAEAWLMSNPTRIKSNYNKFLTTWITKAQDRPQPTNGGNPSAKPWNRYGRTEPEIPASALADIAEANRLAAERRARETDTQADGPGCQNTRPDRGRIPD